MMKHLKAIFPLVIILLLPACDAVINSLFFPDTEYTVNSGELPVYIKPFTLTADTGLPLKDSTFTMKTNRIIIYFHGNAGNLYHRISEASVMYKHGYDIIVSGYRGYGKSTGKPSEKGVYTDGRAMLNYVTYI